MRTCTLTTPKPSVEAALKTLFPYLSNAHARRILDNKDVRVNGSKQHTGALQAGDTVTVYAPDAWLLGLRFTIIEETLDWLVVEKPAGLSAVADRARRHTSPNDTLQAQLQRYCATARLCHRLDHPTGGLLVAAKNDTAEAFILQAMRSGDAEKRYRCLVWGNPAHDMRDGIYDAWLQKDARNALVYITAQSQGGKPIRTGICSLGHKKDAQYELDVCLYTGRTHQIRAHLAYLGHPVVGDDKYGDRAANRAAREQQLRLWATRLTLQLPDGTHTWESVPPF